ncbi:MAG: hypothetical protein OXT67_07320 [Zetaproteobacteria bacterium]|nr:hypothetical protein [Zetaproteobacteria bacterium]
MADEEQNESSKENANPFESELRSDFSSSFGATTTNAVSSMFKDSGFITENRTKLIGILAVLVLAIAGGIFLLSEEDVEDPDDFLIAEEEPEHKSLTEEGLEDKAAQDNTLGADKAQNNEGDDEDLNIEETSGSEIDKLSEDTIDDNDLESIGYEEESQSTSAPHKRAQRKFVAASAPPISQAPTNGASRVYNEAGQRATFAWNPAGGSATLVLSQNEDLSNPIAKLAAGTDGQLEVRQILTPGVWYWQVSNSQGKSEIRRFTILPAPLRKIDLLEPTSGTTLSGNNGIIRWTGDTHVSLYKVQLSTNNSWAQPEVQRATSGTSATLSGVNPGSYQLRIGAFSEVSGQWEFTNPIDITITE